MSDFELTLIIQEILRVLNDRPDMLFEEINQLPYNGIGEGVAFAVKLRGADGQFYTHLQSLTILRGDNSFTVMRRRSNEPKQLEPKV
jgi:hypothetical protein